MGVVLAGRPRRDGALASAGCRGVRAALLSALAPLAACKKETPPPPPPPVVRVSVAEERPVARTEELLAMLDASVNAEIRPQVTGVVQSVDYQEGTVVAAGALMFAIDERPFVDALHKAEGDLAGANAQLSKARADVARFTPLVAENALSRQDLDNARAAEEVANASVQSARAGLEAARLNLEWTRVRSPIRGLAGIAQTRVGNLVGPTAVLTTVSTLDPVRASFNLNEGQYLRYGPVLARVAEGQGGGPSIELLLGADEPYGHPAERVIVGRAFDPATDTLLVQALFPNPGYVLRPGMFAKVRIHGTPSPSVLVPAIAVQEVQGQTHVDVVDGQDRVEARAVKLGQRLDGAVVVESGVRPGDRVVVEGQQGLQPGTKVQVEGQAAGAPSAPRQQQPPDGRPGAGPQGSPGGQGEER